MKEQGYLEASRMANAFNMLSVRTVVMTAPFDVALT